ncbi:hypothetical protein HDU98_010598, partial [Podochytrium sp. JEL0797]
MDGTIPTPPEAMLLGFRTTSFSTALVFCAHVSAAKKSNVSDHFCLNDIPLRSVRLCAAIVSKDERRNLVSYTVDDGSGGDGIVTAIVFDSDDPTKKKPRFRLGDIVSFTGRISQFKNEKQITVDHI